MANANGTRNVYESNLTVAKTILEQLGGGRLMAMTGARNFVGSENSLSFKLPNTRDFVKNGVNYVRVVLDPSDTYTVTFSRVRGLKVVEIASHSDVYCDQLQDIFETETGLFTSLMGVSQ